MGYFFQKTFQFQAEIPVIQGGQGPFGPLGPPGHDDNVLRGGKLLLMQPEKLS